MEGISDRAFWEIMSAWNMGIKNWDIYKKASKGRKERDWDATGGFLCILARNYIVGW